MSDEFVPYLKGDLDARQHRIYNLPDPVDNNEVATKAYVDAGGGSQAVAVATVSVSSAEILSLADTAKQIVAAQGTGKVIVPLSISYVYLAGGTPYTDHGTDLVVCTIRGGSGWVDRPSVGFWDQAVSQFYNAGFLNSQGVAELDFWTDLPLLLDAQGGSNPTDGDGTLIVQVAYSVLDTA